MHARGAALRFRPRCLYVGAVWQAGVGWWASLGNAARVTAGYAPPLQHTLRQRLNISAQSFPLNE